MNYYPHHIGDFNNATRHLTRVERALYRDAIELYYDTEQPLPGDDFDYLAKRLLAVSNEEKSALRDVLNEFFALDGSVYRHSRCDAEIAKYRASAEAKRKAGKASAEKRQRNATSVEHVLNGCATNQKPRTKNQEPRKAESTTPPGKPDGFDFRSELLKLEVDPVVADDWLKLRSKKKAANTKTALAGFVAEVSKAGISVDAAVRECCARSWQGFKAEWISKDARGSPRQSIHDQRSETIAILTGRQKNEHYSSQERDITGECSRVA